MHILLNTLLFPIEDLYHTINIVARVFVRSSVVAQQVLSVTFLINRWKNLGVHLNHFLSSGPNWIKVPAGKGTDSLSHI